MIDSPKELFQSNPEFKAEWSKVTGSKVFGTAVTYSLAQMASEQNVNTDQLAGARRLVLLMASLADDEPKSISFPNKSIHDKPEPKK